MNPLDAFESVVLQDQHFPWDLHDNEMYEKGDERAPFMTEAYLYNLLGKEDARSVLARWKDLKAYIQRLERRVARQARKD